MTPRPKFATAEMKNTAATELAARLVRDGLTDGPAADVARDIAKHAEQYMDGYQIAKALEDHAYWDCDLQLADALDEFAYLVRMELDKAEKAWFEAEHPEPPVAVGTRVSYRSGGKSQTGIVDGVYERGVGQFTVKEDGDEAADSASRRRVILDWEAVTPIEAQS